MTRYEKASKLKDEDFKQIIGVKRALFDEMTIVLREAYAEKHKRRGRHSKLSVEDQLFLSMKYWRQYVTQKELAFEFDVGEATAHDTIIWVENALIKSGKFSLPGKKVLLEDAEIEIVLVDVTESPVERPKKTTGMVLGEKEAAHHQNTADRQPENERNYLYGSCGRQHTRFQALRGKCRQCCFRRDKNPRRQRLSRDFETAQKQRNTKEKTKRRRIDRR